MTSDPLSTERRDFYPAVHDSGGREAAIAYIVIHDGEVPGGEGADELIGGWFQNPASAGSAHVGVDDDTTQRFLDDDVEAWGAPPVNDSALHLEQGGYASWSRAKWLAHTAMIERAGWKIADWMDQHGIPNKFLSVADLKAAGANPPKPQGWTTHANVSDAFKASSHWDPGTNYPLDVLQGFIDQYEEVSMGKANEFFSQLDDDGLNAAEWSTSQRFQWGYQRAVAGKGRPTTDEDAQKGYDHGKAVLAALPA